jgi:hypothetical protein
MGKTNDLVDGTLDLLIVKIIARRNNLVVQTS